MEFDFCKRPGQKRIKECITQNVEPKLTIVTPYYNSDKHFEETYNCVMNQTFEEFEWVIVNDGSTNKEHVAALESYAATDSRIRLFHQENGGQSKAKNYAIRESQTEIIVFLDADDLIEPFYVEYLYKALEQHPNAGWSYMDLAGFEAVEYTWCKHFSAGRMMFNNILVNSAAFRKQHLLDVGCFPEVAKHYDEDWALYLKLLAKEVHPVHIPMIGFWYRKSASGMQQTVRKDEALRKASDAHIAQLAKQVKRLVEAEIYTGALPEEAVKSEYSKADRILANVCKTKAGCFIVKCLYKIMK